MKINKKIIADLGTFLDMRYGISIADNEEKYPELYKSFIGMQYWIDEALLARYFGDTNESAEAKTYWKQHLKFDTRKTGQELLDKINALQDLSPDVPLKILDVGCGDNGWKKHLSDKVTGIDPFNSNADIKLGIQQFAQEHPEAEWDILLILGSINFGDKATIEDQLTMAASLVKPGGKIFLRANPGITHVNKHAQWIDFFNWSEEYIKDVAKRLNFTINELGWDHPKGAPDTPNGNRHYSEWTKK
jgi:hypothetical protein|tara:strand:- start:4627 stop:5364 length:738 start_codon:yes stop_codon:yes gene_type:complete